MKAAEAPAYQRMEMSAGDLACSLLTGIRVAAFYTTVAEDVGGALIDGRRELLAESIPLLFAHGLRSYAGSRGEYLQGGLDEFELLAKVAGRDSEVYREAAALAAENPETIEGLEDLVKRVMTFVECRLDVKPIFHWWDGPWNRSHQDQAWSYWGPAVLMATHVGVNSLGMSLESALEVAEEREAKRQAERRAAEEAVAR